MNTRLKDQRNKQQKKYLQYALAGGALVGLLGFGAAHIGDLSGVIESEDNVSFEFVRFQRLQNSRTPDVNDEELLKYALERQADGDLGGAIGLKENVDDDNETVEKAVLLQDIKKRQQILAELQEVNAQIKENFIKHVRLERFQAPKTANVYDQEVLKKALELIKADHNLKLRFKEFMEDTLDPDEATVKKLSDVPDLEIRTYRMSVTDTLNATFVVFTKDDTGSEAFLLYHT